MLRIFFVNNQEELKMVSPRSGQPKTFLLLQETKSSPICELLIFGEHNLRLKSFANFNNQSWGDFHT